VITTIGDFAFAVIFSAAFLVTNQSAKSSTAAFASFLGHHVDCYNDFCRIPSKQASIFDSTCN
jgi:hypothetical protein